MNAATRLLSWILMSIVPAALALAEESPAKAVVVGVPTVLSGDWAGLGENIVNTTKVYEKYYLRHPLKFLYEDAKLSGIDGLKAYQKLINIDHVDFLIGGTSSNGTMAGAPLINNSKTVMITPVTGGDNVDNAGEWVFRIGNSDVLNGKQQAEMLVRGGKKSTALLCEETEYTLDIAKSFRARIGELGGTLVYDSTFAPATTDFRSQLTALLRTKPAVIFVPTQTGSALALILTQISHLGGYSGEIHTTFTAADNPDAKALAKGKFTGVYYLAPAYDKENAKLKEFIVRYKEQFGREPLITFHTAGTVDALDLLQLYLDKEHSYDSEKFKAFLLHEVKGHRGLMGAFSFDEKGNANTGFIPAKIG